jgi:DNA-binding CsgD family transcriptional regulator/PAS domain-containing protein
MAPSLSNLVARVYEAAIGAEPWSDILSDVARAYNAVSGTFYDFDRRLNRSVLLGTHNLDPAFVAEYENYYGGIDIWNPHLLTWPVGLVNGSHLLVSDNDVLRSEFYNDYLRRAGIFYASGALVDRTPDHASVFGIQHGRANGPLSLTDADPLVALMPHVQQAMKIHRRIKQADQARDTFMAMLDTSPSGALLVDGAARVIFANAAATGLLDRGGGLRLVNGKLMTLRSQDTRRLLAAIRHATGTKDSPPAGDSLVLPRPGAPPLSLLVAPLSHGSRRLAALFIDVPSADQKLETLARRCGLSAAETRLFAGIVSGKTLAEIAAANRVSTNTLRVQLGRVFDKTGTHRQAELIRFALNRTKPAGIRSGN